jgi:molecular chaperone DnaK (HSP70)
MSGRLAIDFGASNTVVAVWDEARGEGVPFHIPEYSRTYQQDGAPSPDGAPSLDRVPSRDGALSRDGVSVGSTSIAVIPSLIHYAGERQRWIGNQVLERQLDRAPGTFRWMKRYISNRSPIKLRLHGRQISYFEAGKDFLSSILLYVVETLKIKDEEVALTVPVEAFEHYENWLIEVAEAVGLPRFRLIDEPSAAALGYGAHIQLGDIYLIFDFGGGTLDAAVVLIEEVEREHIGRRCRVLGKAGADLGGATIDQWLFQEFLRQHHRNDTDDDIRQVSQALLTACEQAKEQLSSHEQADIWVEHPATGLTWQAKFTAQEFEALLDKHEAFTVIDRTIRRVLNKATERGYQEEDIKAVLAVGGSSQIPAVQKTLRRIFGQERVRLNRPLDAVARGAAAFVAGVDFYDHIQHDYAIRYLDRQKKDYAYHIVVEQGTPYPTTAPVARLKVKASYQGQTHLGLAIFELGERRQKQVGQPLELVFDPSGAARLIQLTPEEEERRSHFWMNEGSPTFLTVDSPVGQGEACYEVEFSIDQNKRLLISARNLQTGQMTHRDYPVVKLT